MIYEPASVEVEIRRSCALLMPQDGILEVRILTTGRDGVLSGYFDDAERLIAAVLPYDGAANVYATLNPPKPELRARRYNRLQARAKASTTDADILVRRFILVDCDPVRPADISSSSSEHERSITLAMDVWDTMRGELGDPAAIADSGNGSHLLYAVDLPNNQRSTELVKSVLATIAKRCATDEVSIDQSVFNPSRIVKLWGTMSVKGDSVGDRAHRRSRLLEVECEL